MSAHASPRRAELGEFLSTAVAGNNVLSSVLYVCGISIMFVGAYAPLVVLAVAVVLVLYRAIYREVIEALPLNGGAYTVMLNSTAKPFAAAAGTLTILSYVATAVISAKTAAEYLLSFARTIPSLPQIPNESILLTLAILFAFAMLMLTGVRSSATIAGVIFTIHLITLTVFVLAMVFGSPIGILAQNIAATGAIIASHGGLARALFFGFSVSILGVSGFESAANFIEQQGAGIFKKTLDNITALSIVYNTAVAGSLLFILPFSALATSQSFALAEAAKRVGGVPFLGFIAIDAALVLCGAVLASFIGVMGTAYRMTVDNCLPFCLTYKNRNGVHHLIIITFFAISASVLLVTRGDLFSIAGVSTISFLGVMAVYALGNLVMRKTRIELVRPYEAPLHFVLAGLLITIAAIIGNIMVNPASVWYFLSYFIPGLALAFVLLHRESLYDFLAFALGESRLGMFFRRKHFHALHSRAYVFVHEPKDLHRILDYINRNETSRNVTLVHCVDTAHEGHAALKDEFESLLPALKKAGVFAHLNIDFRFLHTAFEPDTVRRFSREQSVPLHNIFVGTVRHSQGFTYGDLAGVRIIL